MQIVVVLNNVRSSENVGSIFRTADAAGVSKIFLCGYTPAPADKFGRINKSLAKTALGAEKFVEWEKVKSLKVAIEKLKNHSFRSRLLRKSRSKNDFSAWKIVGVEQDKRSINYKKLKKFLNHKSKILNPVFVFGNEVTGLSKKDLSLCDLVAEIPMKGHKESLNVAVTAGVILFNCIQ